jgi:methylphosphotriester-DNA--protein-cysteine methyltransferase
VTTPDRTKPAVVGRRRQRSEDPTELRAVLDELPRTFNIRAHLSQRVRNIAETIHRRFSEPSLNVKTLRATCGVRDNNVSSDFRFAFGVSIREYIELLRLRGTDHLNARGMSITLAAKNAGFACVQTYYRARARWSGRRQLPLEAGVPDGQTPADGMRGESVN